MFPELVSDLLKDGYSVKFNAPGHSMYPTILANEPVLVEPIAPEDIHKGDIILYRSNGSLIAHRVMGVLKNDAANDYFSLMEAFAADPGHLNTSALNKAESGETTQDLKPGDPADNLYFILRGDASRNFDEPVQCDQVIGKVISIERNGSSINPYGMQHKFSCWLSKTYSRLKALLGLSGISQ